MKSEPGVQLIDSIMTPIELGKMLREVFTLDEFLNAKFHGIQSGLKMPANTGSCIAELALHQTFQS